MIRVLNRMFTFIRWIWLTDRLNPLPSELQETTNHRKGLFRWLFSAEELPVDKGKDMSVPDQHGFLRWLFGTEKLGIEERSTRPSRAGFTYWLIAQEKLNESR